MRISLLASRLRRSLLFCLFCPRWLRKLFKAKFRPTSEPLRKLNRASEKSLTPLGGDLTLKTQLLRFRLRLTLAPQRSSLTMSVSPGLSAGPSTCEATKKSFLKKASSLRLSKVRFWGKAIAFFLRRCKGTSPLSATERHCGCANLTTRNRLTKRLSGGMCSASEVAKMCEFTG